jgi:HAD superfamily hydrolase (TIGR01509 family)
VSRPAGESLQAVLFDLDGLLVDSEPLWTVAERELVDRLGGVWDHELKAAMVGKRLDVAVPILLDWCGSAADPDQTATWLLDRMVVLFGQRLVVKDGAAPLLRDLAQAAIPAAVVSSSQRVLVDAALDLVGRGAVRTSVAGDEVTHPKPHPEPYLLAARRLGADPARCVVLEDSQTGITSAEAAGCVAVGVPDVVPLTATDARPVLGSLTEVDLAWLRDLPRRLRSA